MDAPAASWSARIAWDTMLRMIIGAGLRTMIALSRPAPTFPIARDVVTGRSGT